MLPLLTTLQAVAATIASPPTAPAAPPLPYILPPLVIVIVPAPPEGTLIAGVLVLVPPTVTPELITTSLG